MLLPFTAIALTTLSSLILGFPVEGQTIADIQQSDLRSETVTPKSYILTPDIITDKQGRSVHVERGLIFVPENRSNPQSRLIALHFIKFPAITSNTVRHAPVFLLPGGPGWGFDHSNPSVFDEITRLRKMRDVIYVSQRGYPGAPGLVPAMGVQYAPSSIGQSVTTLESVKEDSLTLEAEIKRWQKAGVDVAGYDIINMVDDLKDIRGALGYNKIILRGCSFGSQWSLAYMKRWPNTVERAMLSGVEPLDYGYDSPNWRWAAMERIAKAAETDVNFVHKLPEGGVMQALKVIIERLEEKPVNVQIERPGHEKPISVAIGADDLRGVLHRSRLLMRDTTRNNLARWPRFILEMYEGDYRFLAARVARKRIYGGYQTLIEPLIDNSLGISSERLLRLDKEVAVRWLGDINLEEKITGDITPTPKVLDTFRIAEQIDIPTLMIMGNYDWSTPIENAEYLNGFLKNGHLVKVQGGTHCTETNKDELSSQFPKETEQLYNFIDVELNQLWVNAYFKKLPQELKLSPIKFAPLTKRSLYDEWRSQF